MQSNVPLSEQEVQKTLRTNEFIKFPEEKNPPYRLGTDPDVWLYYGGDLWRIAKGHHSWYREHLAPHREASWRHFSFADVEFRNLRQREPVICCRTRQNWRSVVFLHCLLMLPFSASSSQLHWSEKYLWGLKTRIEVKDNFSDVSYWTSPKVILGIKLHSWPQGWHLKCILCEF